MTLREYQTTDVEELRPLVREHQRVLYQLPTGGGKTIVDAAIIGMAGVRNPQFVVWFITPRNDLVDQASGHMHRHKISHGLIAHGREESRAFRVQIISKDTLLRRLHRIKNWPDFLIFDEAHLYYDAQLAIIAECIAHNPLVKIMGQTATPERYDGRGLSVEAGGPYEVMHESKSIPWLMERGYMAKLRYFSPELVGLRDIHKRGTQYDRAEVEDLLKRRKVYGDMIGYYKKYGVVQRTGISLPGEPTIETRQNYHKGKPALVFCNSVRSAYETAQMFTDAGFLFYTIEGKMPYSERKALIDAHRRGEIDGLTNVDIATYGLDIPRVEYGIGARPTLSLALYFQMLGRELRPFEERDANDHVTYVKEEALWWDHVNLIRDHQDPRYPDMPMHFVPDIQWNFNGKEKRERAPASKSMRFCALRDNEYCLDPACRGGCKMMTPISVGRQILDVVDAPLVERAAPRVMAELAPEEKRGVQDRIARAADAYLGALQEDPPRIAQGPVGDLLLLAWELGRPVMWVYQYLSAVIDTQKAAEHGMTLTEYRRIQHAVNVPLLMEIGRQARTKDGRPYARGWAWAKKHELEEAAEAEREEAKEEAVG